MDPHPHMFPTGAVPSVQTSAECEVDAAPAVRPATTPWVNPFGKPADATKASPASRIEQVMAILKERGPTSAGDICAALGIDGKAGITPYIGSALRDQRIVREGGLDKIGDPGDTKPSDATASSKPPGAPRKTTRTDTSSPPRNTPTEPVPTVATLFTDGVHLGVRADGRVTVTVGERQVDLKPSHLKLMDALLKLVAFAETGSQPIDS